MAEFQSRISLWFAVGVFLETDFGFSQPSFNSDPTLQEKPFTVV
jgi:hypothetical protein